MRKFRKFLPLIVFVIIGVSLYIVERERETLRELLRGRSEIIDRIIPPSDRIPLKDRLSTKLKQLDWKPGGEVFIRIFKQENLLEAYGRRQNEAQKEQWVLLKSWPICRWSGALGPKHAEGDRQAPEGFYMVTKNQLLPTSQHHLAFNLGFPNQVEKAKGKTGSFLMVHGNCSSAGCYAMTNPGIDEIYGLVEAALLGGQKQIPVHAFPFRLSDEKLTKYKNHHAYDYWRKELKPGYDLFEQHREVPIVLACNDRYGFAEKDVKLPGGCEPLKGW